MIEIPRSIFQSISKPLPYLIIMAILSGSVNLILQFEKVDLKKLTDLLNSVLQAGMELGQGPSGLISSASWWPASLWQTRLWLGAVMTQDLS